MLLRDNGDGICDQQLQHLFDRLEQGEVHGSGVGLPLARKLMRRWGGDISVRSSAPGQGTELGLTFLRSPL